MIDPDGAPFFWLGDTAWPIFARLTQEEADLYLADRADKGFNIIQAVAIGGPFDMLDVPNRYGELALIDFDPAKPNPRYFEHIDWVIERALRYGLRFALLPVWGGSLVGGLQSRSDFFTPETARTYGEWIGSRYRGNGIVWVLGGDTNPLWPHGMDFLAHLRGQVPAVEPGYPVLKDYRPIYDAMAEGLLAGDGSNPLLTFHPNPVSFSGSPPPRTSFFFSDRTWFGLNMLQSSHYENDAVEIFPWLRSNYTLRGPDNYLAVRAEYDSMPTRPVVDGEPRYEGLPVDIKWDALKGSWTAYDARNAAYHAVFAGAAGHTYGNTSVHMFWDPSVREKDAKALEQYPDMGGHWREQMGSDGASQMQHLKNLMLSRPFFSRVPDQAIIIGDAGIGTDHVGATRDSAGSYGMVYLPRGKPVTLDLSWLSSERLVGWWFDPRTGAATRMRAMPKPTSSRQFHPPTSGDTSDWVLVIDDADRNFPPPGCSG